MATNTGDGYIRISADISECMAVFDGFNVNRHAIQRRLLSTIGTGARLAVKRNLDNYLHRKSGTLYRSIRSVMSKSGRSVIITNNASSGKPTAKDGRDARYGFMLAAGYTIQAKTSKGLTFNIHGQWFKKHSVTVKPKDYVEPTVEKYVDSADAHQRLDKELQRQIDYWDKRLSKG